MPTIQPLITVVTPSYNQAEFLERTIKSVLLQNYANLEYMILDGGSSDGSTAIMSKYNDRLAYCRTQRDNGQGASIWEGINRASGEIFAWLNSDDIYLPGTLDFVGKYFLDNPECKILAGNCLRIGKGGEKLSTVFCAPSQSAHSQLFWGCWCLQPAVFWRRTLLLEAGPINSRLQVCFDSEYAIRYTRLAKWHKVNRTLAAIRIHNETKTNRLIALALKELEEIRTVHGYYSVRPAFRLVYRIAYRIRYELQRLAWASVGRLSCETPVWGDNPNNADPQL